ncbi:MAG: NAD(+) diphosphatase [Pseudomonadota bacterium]
MDISATIPFSGTQLDRCEAHRADADWLAQQHNAQNAQFLVLNDLKVGMFAHGDLKPAYLMRDDVAAALSEPEEDLFLGKVGPAPLWALSIDKGHAERLTQMGLSFIDVRTIAMQMHGPELALVGHARSMLSWHAKNQFCGICGAPTVMQRGGASRKCTNPDCGQDFYPRNDPVVIMLAHDEDHCLVGRQHRFPPKMYSALAGFLEHGESLEEAVRRETFEEAGISIGQVDYVASQPWPFEHSIMIGCLAAATSRDITIDAEELDDARWVSAADVKRALVGDRSAPIAVPPDMAIAHHLMKHWAERF